MARVVSLIPKPLRQVAKSRLERWFGSVEMSRPYELVVAPDRRPLEGKIAVVTGASGAIGRSISIQLAMDGAEVIALARNTDKLRDLVDEITTLGGSARWDTVDLSDTSAIEQAAARIGPIDVLVNNAGGSSRRKNTYIWEQTSNTIDEILAVNLRATMITTKVFGAIMLGADRGGRIINLGSTVAVGGLAKFSEYAAAKAGVVGYTQSAALEFGPHSITVNCVTPGIVLRGEIPQKRVESTLTKSVLPRLGRAEDISQMVAFLAGPRAEWITGQEFIVDGGRSIGLHGEQ